MSAPAAVRDGSVTTARPAASPELIALRSAAAVRERCGRVRDWVAQGRSPHFLLDVSKLDAAAARIAHITQSTYPDLVIPHHSRWRHFCAGDCDRWAALPLAGLTALERARAAIDLTVVSVLLDAGAGAAWRYRDAATGLVFTRSEGLAVASFDTVRTGLFSSHADQPLQVDRTALGGLALAPLAAGFQASEHNPLLGLPQRLTLLHRLGEALGARPDLFGATGRPGHLIDAILAAFPGRAIAAADLLALLLDGLSTIWPSGLTIDGVALGDAGRHPAIRTGDRSDGVVPFHKLSQWLAYSLIEPLAEAGVAVVEPDGLTGLAEYRNGGLLVDTSVIVPRAPLDPGAPHEAASELIVEWRALTVALLDPLREATRRRLGLAALSMSQLLQGGTWSAGRAIALEKRPPEGPPPIAVAADGTVF